MWPTCRGWENTCGIRLVSPDQSGGEMDALSRVARHLGDMGVGLQHFRDARSLDVRDGRGESLPEALLAAVSFLALLREQAKESFLALLRAAAHVVMLAPLQRV